MGCHNQFRAICADIEEVKTMNSKRSAKQEDESRPPPARQRQSAHKRGNCSNGVDCSPSSFLCLDIAPPPPPDFHLFDPLKDAFQERRFADKEELKPSMGKELR